MIYSAACEYAVRALARLADPAGGGLIKVRDLAAEERIPYPFLAKIFNDLVSDGLVRAVRGPRGGYALARPPRQITLLDIRRVVDGPGGLDACAVGLERCTDEAPCPLHDTWKPIRERIQTYLRETSLSDLTAALARKRQPAAARSRTPGQPPKERRHDVAVPRTTQGPPRRRPRR